MAHSSRAHEGRPGHRVLLSLLPWQSCRPRSLLSPASWCFPVPTQVGKGIHPTTLARVLRRLYRDCCTLHGFRLLVPRPGERPNLTAPHAVAEAALAHAVASAVERSYARSDLFEQRSDLMNRWAAFVTSDGIGVRHGAPVPRSGPRT